MQCTSNLFHETEGLDIDNYADGSIPFALSSELQEILLTLRNECEKMF